MTDLMIIKDFIKPYKDDNLLCKMKKDIHLFAKEWKQYIRTLFLAGEINKDQYEELSFYEMLKYTGG